MSLTTIWKCDICEEAISAVLDGFGVVFRSMIPGDFKLGSRTATEGKHICQECAKTLLKELRKYAQELEGN